MAHKLDSVELFNAALDLYAMTRKPAHADLAKRLFPKLGLEDTDATEQYDALFHENHTAQIRDRLVARAEDILARSGGNPFGAFRYGSKDRPSYLWPPPPGGTEAEDGGGSPGGSNTDLLPAAITVAQAYRYRRDPRYLAFVYDQLNWILGANPIGVCMLEGAGSLNPPSYHACIAFAGVERGAIPGGHRQRHHVARYSRRPSVLRYARAGRRRLAHERDLVAAQQCATCSCLPRSCAAKVMGGRRS